MIMIFKKFNSVTLKKKIWGSNVVKKFFKLKRKKYFNYINVL